MTEPTPPPSFVPPPGDTPPAPSPFDRPTLETPRSTGPGVGKPLLIGCGVLLLLLLVAGALFVANQNRIAGWLFEVMESQLATLVPEDAPADVRERYDLAFDRAIEALRSGEYDPFAMQGAQQAFSSVLREVGSRGEGARMSVEDMERIAAALEEIPTGGAEGEGEDGAGAAGQQAAGAGRSA